MPSITKLTTRHKKWFLNYTELLSGLFHKGWLYKGTVDSVTSLVKLPNPVDMEVRTVISPEVDKGKLQYRYLEFPHGTVYGTLRHADGNGIWVPLKGHQDFLDIPPLGTDYKDFVFFIISPASVTFKNGVTAKQGNLVIMRPFDGVGREIRSINLIEVDEFLEYEGYRVSNALIGDNSYKGNRLLTINSLGRKVTNKRAVITDDGDLTVDGSFKVDNFDGDVGGYSGSLLLRSKNYVKEIVLYAAAGYSYLRSYVKPLIIIAPNLRLQAADMGTCVQGATLIASSTNGSIKWSSAEEPDPVSILRDKWLEMPYAYKDSYWYHHYCRSNVVISPELSTGLVDHAMVRLHTDIMSYSVMFHGSVDNTFYLYTPAATGIARYSKSSDGGDLYIEDHSRPKVVLPPNMMGVVAPDGTKMGVSLTILDSYCAYLSTFSKIWFTGNSNAGEWNPNLAKMYITSLETLKNDELSHPLRDGERRAIMPMISYTNTHQNTADAYEDAGEKLLTGGTSGLYMFTDSEAVIVWEFADGAQEIRELGLSSTLPAITRDTAAYHWEFAKVEFSDDQTTWRTAFESTTQSACKSMVMQTLDGVANKGKYMRLSLHGVAARATACRAMSLAVVG